MDDIKLVNLTGNLRETQIESKKPEDDLFTKVRELQEKKDQETYKTNKKLFSV